MMVPKKINLMFSINFFIFFLLCSVVEAKSINTFIPRYGGKALTSGDEVHLAKHDIIFCHKFHYNDIDGDTWGAIKKINPNAKIYLYTMTSLVSQNTGSVDPIYLAELGRYSVSRGHSMGSLNGSNPSLFLLDQNGNRIRWNFNSKPYYWLDFGDKRFQNYAIEAIVTDNADAPWRADGILSDYAFPTRSGMSVWPAKYDTDAKWSGAMISMVLAMTAGLHAEDQNFAGNSGPTYNTITSEAWKRMDQSSNHPDVLFEEGAFAVKFGGGDIQFLSESKWLNQISLLSSLKNIKACFKSSCDLSPSQNGIDNYGKSFTFWDGFYFALGSYLLGKNDVNDTAFFNFDDGLIDYNSANQYYDEYGIDLGKSLGDYQVTAYSGKNIYRREFEKGYVYVNPTTSDVTSIKLPEACKQLTHSNLKSNPQLLPDTTSINLKSHRAAILYKKNYSSSSAATGDIIIDNKDSGDVSSTGTWRESSGSYEWAGSSFWSRDGATFKFHFDCPETGRYEVFERHSLWSSRSNSVVMKIEHNGSATPANRTVNQKIGGQSWNSLGEFNYTAGLTYTVTVVSQPGPSSTCADAIMFRLK